MSDIDHRILKLYERVNKNTIQAVDIWRNFINYNFGTAYSFLDEQYLLAYYNARLSDFKSDIETCLIFETEADKLDFLLTWS